MQKNRFFIKKSITLKNQKSKKSFGYFYDPFSIGLNDSTSRLEMT